MGTVRHYSTVSKSWRSACTKRKTSTNSDPCRNILRLVSISVPVALIIIFWALFMLAFSFSNVARTSRFLFEITSPIIPLYRASTGSERRPPKKLISTKWYPSSFEFLHQFHRKGKCVDGWFSRDCYAHVVTLAKSRAVNGTVTLLVATNASLPIVLNWCISQKLLGIDNYVLVALDKIVYNSLRQLQAPVTILNPGKELRYSNRNVHRKSVWIKRTLASYMILREGIDVLINDADAVSVKSPFTSPYSYFQYSNLDIISSPSNFPNPRFGELPSSCPQTLSEGTEWRHQPCMGWILLRSSENMLRFYEDIFLRDVLTFQDDQIGFNCAIRKARAKWNDHQWGFNRTMLTQLEQPLLSLLMLPVSQYVRNCTDSKLDRIRGYGIWGFEPSKVQMYHCKGGNKQKNAQTNEFWFLRDDWKEIQIAGSWDLHLEHLTNDR